MEGVAGSLEGSRLFQLYVSPKVSSHCYHTPPLCHPGGKGPARVTKQTLQGYCTTHLSGAPAESPPRVAW